ncbi:helix-turn-helix domain-containing protein [Rhizobium sp. BK251]|uniref:winged helix-turn-helix transcriptional regulator n=1 Tax=Rhizobium sp. BK251 TaxID=2512125 RepID=UPI00104E7F6E|nr:helix-turn-helix domain-containing protein [Rhizobium sp. BK251]TCL64600.1 HxlR family transcriptional regulator [Rhizobium sp. BK251]
MKGKKTDLGALDCGIARALSVIGDWWSLLIIRDAFRGEKRFGEFQKNLGLARNILSARLKKLVDAGILRTEPESEGSAYNAYVLTEKGERLGVVLLSLWQWGEENCFSEGELDRVMVERHSKEPLARLSLSTQSGRAIGMRDFTTVSKAEALPATRQ